MQIRIDTSSAVSIRRQLVEQIVFLIATGQIEDGETLPSVRQLARTLKVHHNTVSDAYQELVHRKWLDRRRGSRLAAIARQGTSDRNAAVAPDDLDDLINKTIAAARAGGYSMQELRVRVRERLLIEPPDHILVIEQDPGLRELIQEELREVIDCPVEVCSREDLEATPGLAIGALAVTPQYALRHVNRLFPKDRPVVPVRFSPADEHLEALRAIAKPSIIAVVSVSRSFLDVARGVLAPAIGNRHEIREVFLGDETPAAARAADRIYCDSIARKRLRSVKATHYRLLLPASVAYLVTAMKAYRT